MELRAQTFLMAAVFATAISVTVLLRPRKSRVHWLFVAFAGSVGIWYATTFLMAWMGPGPVLTRLNLCCALLVPLAAERFFRAFATGETRRVTIFSRSALAVGLLLVGTVLTPYYESRSVRLLIFAYVLALLTSSLAILASHVRSASSRFERARLAFLVVSGGLAALFALADYLVYVGISVPPIGSALTLLFLYVLSQSIVRLRLMDLYELTGRLTVLVGLAFILAGIFWALTTLSGGGVFWRALFAALVVLLVYDPVRERVQQRVSQIFFRERYDLEQRVQNLRRRLAHVLEVELLPELVLGELEHTRRVTHAALYLVAHDMRSFRLAGCVGPPPPARIEFAAARPLLDRLRGGATVVREQVERELSEERDGRRLETVHEVLQILDAVHCSVVWALGNEQEIFGMLCLRDERLRDAFSPEELSVLSGLAAQIAAAVQNSRLYERMKERDRLAMMGEMAAGLAHEIRNPLGAIKASAQYLAEDRDSSGNEFLDIIVEEADRLNRVVSSFLEYAHPASGDPSLIDVNAVVQRTVQVLGAEYEQVDWQDAVRLARHLPRVRIDPEHLRQVLINLLQNALEAIEDRGTLRVTTGTRKLPVAEGGVRRIVEIEVSDTGPGIPEQILATMFEPFVTTRSRGTGLGLAISQRLVRSAGGRIEVRSRENYGSTFTVRLPVLDDDSSELPLPDETLPLPLTRGGEESEGGETPSGTGLNR